MKLQSLRVIMLVLIGLLFLSISSVYAETAEEHFNKGNGSDDPDEAIAEFTKAIELNPNYAEAYNERGFVYEADKNTYSQAIVDFSKAIEISPNFVSAYINRATMYDSIGEYDKAIADLNRVSELQPNYPPKYSSRALVYFHKGDYDKAWQDVHKAESLGEQVYPSFLEELKKASGREN